MHIAAGEDPFGRLLLTGFGACIKVCGNIILCLFAEAATVFGFSRVHFGFGGGGHCLIEVGWSMERCVVEFLECESSFVCPVKCHFLFVFLEAVCLDLFSEAMCFGSKLAMIVRWRLND